MILQALTKYYEDLAARGEISQPGWSGVKVSYALYIDSEGNLTDVVPTITERLKGKKTVTEPRTFVLPAQVKRSSGVKANFLCDNSAYILGVDGKDNPQRAMECFEACKTLHMNLLEKAESPTAKAVVAFFKNWNPDAAAEHPALKDRYDDVISGGNLVFKFGSGFVQDEPEIREIWNNHYMSKSDGSEMVCLVTGKKGHVEKIHPSIKGIPGAQSSGAALVSFNAPAFCSYGKEQNYNAPTGQYAAFAYTTALNHLIADKEHTNRIGDTTVVCWAEGGEPAYQGMFGGAFFGDDKRYTEHDLMEKMKRLAQGQPIRFDETMLDPNRPFYVLGISPNAARLSVRFFLRNSFGEFMKNAALHQERLEIVRPKDDEFETIPIWRLMKETVNQNSRDKSSSPQMSGDMLRAILSNTRYPATLLNGITLRIRADHEMNRTRAAAIKAYYLQNPNIDIPKQEVLTVSLNQDSKSIPYQLGRLFSVLENIQSAANPGINTTIKDKYFNSASSTPAVVFPVLINLAQKHLKKIGGGLQVTLDKQLTEIMNKLDEEYPAKLNLPQQGAFQLGYYHQTQTRYQGKKED